MEFHVESDSESAAATAAEAAAERERGLADSLARESERAKNLEQHLMQLEDVDASKQQEEERKRVLEVRIERGFSLSRNSPSGPSRSVGTTIRATA